MREIKFRGQTANCKWVYGSLVHSKNIEPAIYFESGKGSVKTFDFVYVKPETVGQFTGLTDKNGNKIFEGDIIKRTIHCSYSNDGMAYDVLFQVPRIQELYGNKIEKDDASNSIDLWETRFEVIGNIHDNPDLLEVTE